MDYSWKTVEEKEENTKKTSSAQINFWQENKTSLIFLGIGIILFTFSFFVSDVSDFSADLIDDKEEDFVKEAQTISFDDFINESFEELEEETDKNLENQKIEPELEEEELENKEEIENSSMEAVSFEDFEEEKVKKEEENIDNSNLPVLKAEEKTEDDLNPFLSFQEENSFHKSAEEKTEEDFKDFEEVFPENKKTAQVNENLDFKNFEEETFHNVAEIKPVKSEENVLIGILKPAYPRHNKFGFYLELNNKEKVFLDTNRDLRPNLGDKIKIRIDGTKESFVLKSLMVVKEENLPKTGTPLFLVFLSSLLVVGLRFLKRI
jgi:chemotaxis protein histidine kinase CheA